MGENKDLIIALLVAFVGVCSFIVVAIWVFGAWGFVIIPATFLCLLPCAEGLGSD